MSQVLRTMDIIMNRAYLAWGFVLILLDEDSLAEILFQGINVEFFVEFL